ncbi:hypothetical protein M0P65_04570 [Candidatus Gracilibacteria bacterium]|nr:hypothetical protein [Candidatus Gracilibacteria bacterium]
MKKIIITTFLFFYTTSTFATGVVSCNNALDGSKEFQTYCENIVTCENIDPLNKGESLLKVESIPFTEASADNDSDSIYNVFLNKIGAGGTVDISLASGPFEKSKIVYRETVNKVFNCAILKSKLKIGNTILKYIKKGDSSSNISTKIKTQNEDLKNMISEYKCATSENSKDFGYKKALVDNVTFHYCNYRYYLDYLQLDSRNNISGFMKYSSGASKTDYPVNEFKIRLAKNDLQIANEITHSKDVYEQALVAFNEFENTYPSHIVLLFIYSEYVEIRNNLNKFLSPISQLMYKIPQAQKQ